MIPVVLTTGMKTKNQNKIINRFFQLIPLLEIHLLTITTSIRLSLYFITSLNSHHSSDVVYQLAIAAGFIVKPWQIFIAENFLLQMVCSSHHNNLCPHGPLPQRRQGELFVLLTNKSPSHS